MPKKKLVIRIILTTFALLAASAVTLILINRDKPDPSSQDSKESNQEQSIQLPNKIGDTEGASPALNRGDPVSSTSGSIKIYSPYPNQVLSSGDIIDGEAQFSSVSYRIIDFQRGVITQGELKVVDGNFSAQIESLTSSGSDGQIEFYHRNPESGQEEDNLEIPIHFK